MQTEINELLDYYAELFNQYLENQYFKFQLPLFESDRSYHLNKYLRWCNKLLTHINIKSDSILIEDFINEVYESVNQSIADTDELNHIIEIVNKTVK
jgi:hypothetical protein